MPPPSDPILRSSSALIARFGAAARPRTSPLCHQPTNIATTRSIPISTVTPTAQDSSSPIWFNPSFPHRDYPKPRGNLRLPDDERKVKLGKTLRILQERLPTLLQSPLPQDILAPNISLHLFPSTYPYLPTVSGRVGYMAAIWTSPIAWNQVPIIGNTKLDILSERMTSQPLHFSPRRSGAYGEQLVVKWRTANGRPKSSNPSLTERGERQLNDHLRGTQSVGEKNGFTGLFVFEFDKDGKIISHTIEHVDQHGEWEKGMGAKVVGLTDWLIGGIKGRSNDNGGALPMFQIAVAHKRPGKQDK